VAVAKELGIHLGPDETVTRSQCPPRWSSG